MKRSIAFLLIFCALILSRNLYAEKKGAELEIVRADSQRISGELIAVKKDSLLLKDSQSEADFTVDVNDIKTIIIVKKSKILKGLGYGFLIGASAGALAGALSDEKGDDASLEQWMGFYGAIGACVGLLVGGIAGAVSGKDKTIQLEGMSEAEIKKILEDLRKKARVSNFQ